MQYRKIDYNFPVEITNRKTIALSPWKTGIDEEYTVIQRYEKREERMNK